MTIDISRFSHCLCPEIIADRYATNAAYVQHWLQVSLLKAAHSLWIKELLTVARHSWFLGTRTANTSSATKHSLARLRVLKSWTLLLLLYLLHQRWRWHKLSALGRRDEDDEQTRTRDIALYSRIDVASR